MTLSTPTKPLIEALDAAAVVIKPVSSLPVLSCALVECGKDGVSITCDSLESRITIRVDGAKSDEAFSFLVAPKMLRYALRGDGAKIALDDLKLRIESGGSTSLATLPVKDFPAAWKPVPRHPVDATELLSAIKSTSALVDPSATGSSGVIYWDPAHARMVGCGGPTLSASPVGLLMDENFLLPAVHARTILSCLSSDDALSAGVFGTVFCVSSAERVLYMRLMEGTYPNYAAFIPESSPCSILSRDELIQGLRGLSGFMDQYHKVRIEVLADKWAMSAGGGDNESSIEIEAKTLKQVPPVTVNAMKVLAIIQQWACDSIAVTITDGKMLFHPETKTGQIGVTTLYREVEEARS